MTGELLVRSLRFAVERQRLQAHVETLVAASWITTDGETHDHDREVVMGAPFLRQLIAEQLPATGVGLGLYLARQLAILHDGELTDERDPATDGARFVVQLPTG